ncbi:hypothetical protein BD779DRAFT_1508058 [Infundibulicybe gibba]|nr:hypothetical protein BD779DRAFT_1508058 [Infundibulicybe gibba]
MPGLSSLNPFTRKQKGYRPPTSGRRFDTISSPRSFASPTVLDINEKGLSPTTSRRQGLPPTNVGSAPLTLGQPATEDGDWFPPNLLESDPFTISLEPVEAGGSRTQMFDEDTRASLYGGQPIHNSNPRTTDDEHEPEDDDMTSSEDVLAELKAMDASSFVNQLDSETGSPNTVCYPCTISIPNAALHGPKFHILRSADATAPPVSRPESQSSTAESSAVSGTTLARALMANTFVLSADTRASRYRSGVSVLTRSDSATLPQGEHPYLASPFWREGNAESMSAPGSGQSRCQPSQSESQMNLEPITRRITRISEVPSTTSSIPERYVNEVQPATPDASDPPSDRGYDPHLLSPPTSSLLPHSPGQSSTSEGPSSAKDIENVLDYYSFPDTPDPSAMDTSFKPTFSPISEESISQLSPRSPMIVDRFSAHGRVNPSAVASTTPGRLEKGGRSPESRISSQHLRDASGRALLPIGGRPRSRQMSPGPSTANTSTSFASSSTRSYLSSTSDVDVLSPLVPPPTSKVFNRQRSGSAPNPILVVRDSKDITAYNITVASRPGSVVGQTPSTADSDSAQQTFPETPRAFSPIWSPAPTTSPVPGLPYTPPSAGMPNLAQQVMLARAASSVRVARESRQVGITRAHTVTHPSGSRPQSRSLDLPRDFIKQEEPPTQEPFTLSKPPALLNSATGAASREIGQKDLPLPLSSPSSSSLYSLSSPPGSAAYSGMAPNDQPGSPPSVRSRPPSRSGSASIHSPEIPSAPNSASSTQASNRPKIPPIPPSPAGPPPSPFQQGNSRVLLSKSPSVRSRIARTPPPTTAPNEPPNEPAQTPTPAITPSTSFSINAPQISPPPPVVVTPPLSRHRPSLSGPIFEPEIPSFGSPPPYDYIDHGRNPGSHTPSTGGSRNDRSPRFTTPFLPATQNQDNRPAAINRHQRVRPPLPAGPRRPSQPGGNLLHSSMIGSRQRNGSISSIGSTPNGAHRRPSNTSPRFQTPPLKWRGYTMDAAKWTFTSEQLQNIVSRAIRQSAEPTSIRLLKLETLDNDIPEELHRLEMQRTDVKTRYKMLVRQRGHLLDSLSSYLDGSDADDSTAALGSIADLRELSTSLDRFAEELHSVDKQISQLNTLCQVHSASALAMALRKLNASFLKQFAETQSLKAQVQTLEAERDEAWKQAEDVANEYDHLNEKVDTPSSEAQYAKRSNRVSAVRKSSIRVSKAGLRSSSARLSQRSSTSSVGQRGSASMLPSSTRTTFSTDDIPPVPPIPRQRPQGIITDFSERVSVGISTGIPTPNSETRAMVRAQEELYALLGVSLTEKHVRRSRSVIGLGSADLAVHPRVSSPTQVSVEAPSHTRPASLPGVSSLDIYDPAAADRNAMLATLGIISD